MNKNNNSSAKNRLKKIDKEFNEKEKNLKLILGNKFNKIFTKPKNISVEISKTKHNKLEFWEDDSKILFKVKANFHGVMEINEQQLITFYWSNTIPGVDKRFVDKTIKMRNMYKNIFSDSNDKRILFYHQFLNSDQIIIPDNYLNNIYKLLMYITGDYYYFCPVVSNVFQVFTLSKVDDQYFIEKYI